MMSAHPRSPEFDGFFEHAQHGRLAFPRCDACLCVHWYPMPICPHCQGTDIAWQPVTGRGEIFSFTRVHHAFDKSRRDALPYVVALIVFEDAPGVQFITNLIGSPQQDIAIGRPVEAVFPASDGTSPPVLFRLI